MSPYTPISRDISLSLVLYDTGIFEEWQAIYLQTPPRSGFVPGVPVIREAAWFGQEHCIWRVLPSLGASAGGTRHLFLVDVVPTRFFLLQVILPFVIGNLCGDALRDSMYTVPHWSHP